MSVHAFADSLGNSYLGLTSGKRYLTRYFYIGKHKMNLRLLNERLFVFFFSLLSLLFLLNKEIDSLINIKNDIKYASEKLSMILAGSCYIVVVILAMYYKLTW